MVERFTSRKLITQTLVGYAMPNTSSEEIITEGYRLGVERYTDGEPSHLEFDWGPTQSVTTVETIDISNVETTYAASNYYLDNFDEDFMPRIVFNETTVYPTSLRRKDAWRVTWIAGYGDNPVDVPADIRRAIIMTASYLWGNRGACANGKCVEGCGASTMLGKFKLGSILS